jgi:hypothetical protein
VKLAKNGGASKIYVKTSKSDADKKIIKNGNGF